MIAAVSLDASEHRRARLRTSSATTANPSPGFTRARSFHGGIQRQDIDLEGNIVDNPQNFRNALARRTNLIHQLRELAVRGVQSFDNSNGFERQSGHSSRAISVPLRDGIDSLR